MSLLGMNQDFKWCVAIIASREDLATLKSSTIAASAACTSYPALIDVLVNGNERLARSVAESMDKAKVSELRQVAIRIWSLALPDKADTWNRYVYEIWPKAHTTFFIDGYVRPETNSFSLLANLLNNEGQFACASGIPLTGRSAAQYKKEVTEQGWGLHGNLYALSQDTMNNIRANGFRMPKGLYRNDGFLAAALALDLRPESATWDAARRLGIVDDAGWSTPQRKWWNPIHLKDAWKRRRRQQRGVIENAAIRYWLSTKKTAFADLPDNIDDIVLGWMRDTPGSLDDLCEKRPGIRKHIEQFAESKDWTLSTIPPSKLLERPLIISGTSD